MSDTQKNISNLQDKLDQLKNWTVTNPLSHKIPDFSPEMTNLMYWGITYTKQLHAWLQTLVWDSTLDVCPDISFLELYVNFK